MFSGKCVLAPVCLLQIKDCPRIETEPPFIILGSVPSPECLIRFETIKTGFRMLKPTNQ
jgi:hypothetical protein